MPYFPQCIFDIFGKAYCHKPIHYLYTFQEYSEMHMLSIKFLMLSRRSICFPSKCICSFREAYAFHENAYSFFWETLCVKKHMLFKRSIIMLYKIKCSISFEYALFFSLKRIYIIIKGILSFITRLKSTTYAVFSAEHIRHIWKSIWSQAKWLFIYLTRMRFD